VFFVHSFFWDTDFARTEFDRICREGLGLTKALSKELKSKEPALTALLLIHH
jgi:hypothetical protein